MTLEIGGGLSFLSKPELISMIMALQNELERERNGQAFRAKVLNRIASGTHTEPLAGIKLTGRKPK